MAQHDGNIANSDGATVRGDINDYIAAGMTLNSGTTAPSTTFAFMLWADTTTGLLKQRNAANSAWIVIGTMADAGWGLKRVLQPPVVAVTTAYASGSTAIPLDDTIPQNTEGTEFLTATITPVSATSELVIESTMYAGITSSAGDVVIALFQDSISNALAGGSDLVLGVDKIQPITLKHKMISGTTSPTTFKIRMGSPTGNAVRINGASGNRFLGGVCSSIITITEYAV